MRELIYKQALQYSKNRTKISTKRRERKYTSIFK